MLWPFDFGNTCVIKYSPLYNLIAFSEINSRPGRNGMGDILTDFDLYLLTNFLNFQATTIEFPSFYFIQATPVYSKHTYFLFCQN